MRLYATVYNRTRKVRRVSQICIIAGASCFSFRVRERYSRSLPSYPARFPSSKFLKRGLFHHKEPTSKMFRFSRHPSFFSSLVLLLLLPQSAVARRRAAGDSDADCCAAQQKQAADKRKRPELRAGGQTEQRAHLGTTTPSSSPPVQKLRIQVPRRLSEGADQRLLISPLRAAAAAQQAGEEGAFFPAVSAAAGAAAQHQRRAGTLREAAAAIASRGGWCAARPLGRARATCSLAFHHTRQPEQPRPADMNCKSGKGKSLEESRLTICRSRLRSAIEARRSALALPAVRRGPSAAPSGFCSSDSRPDG